MATILDGKAARDSLALTLRSKIEGLEDKLTLVILQVGDRPDSSAFIRQKKLFAKTIGAVIHHEQFSESIMEEELIEHIEKYNKDQSVHGIILQIPLPPHLHKEILLEKINPLKDIDGLTSINTKLLFDGNGEGLMPATARGIISLLEYYKISLKGKRVVVVGRSTLVGKPTALACLNKDATVTIVHTETPNLKEITRQSEILIVGIGDPEFITHEFVSKGQVIIDVGINPGEEKKIVGDTKFAELEPIVAAITPVPGGVGPMTVVSLFQNLLDAYTLLNS